MSVIEMQKLFGDKGNELEILLRCYGFEKWLMQLSDDGIEKCINWACEMCSEKGHVGYDHEKMVVFFS